MSTYALIHGAGDSAFYWHLLEPKLRERGHDVVAMDLPCQDESAGLAEYADAVAQAIGDRSRGTGARRPILRRLHRAARLSAPASRDDHSRRRDDSVAWREGDHWPANTGFDQAARRSGVDYGDEIAVFYNDVPGALAAEAMRHARTQADRPGQEPWPLDAWPDVPTRYLLCSDDRFFPADWMREVVRERLGIEPDEIASGHCPALSRPRELAGRLESYRTTLKTSDGVRP